MKSRVLAPKYGPMTERQAVASGWQEEIATEEQQYDETVREMDMQVQKLEADKRIQKAMHIAQFFNPIAEIVDDGGEDLME